jgi:hypothetical protein
MKKILNFRILYTHIKVLYTLFAVGAIAVAYQNCGSGFKSFNNPDFANLSSVVPTISVTLAPPVLTNQNAVNIQFRVDSNVYATVASVTCQLDNGTPETCTDSFARTNMPDGDHQLRIVATDSRNNVSAPTVVMWRVDATAPVAMVNSAPAAVTGQNTAAFVFSATDALSGVTAFECALDAANFATCVSPQNLANLTAGAHTYRIRAIDAAGNVSPVVTHNWRVDMTAPVLTITAAPLNFSNSRTASFTFNGTDEGTNLTAFECRLDNGAFEACTSPRAYNNLTDGAHTFSLRATDLAGNMSSPITHAWTVDTVAPTVSLMTATTNPTNQTTASFQFTPADVGSGVLRTECSINGGAFATCTSPAAYNNLVAGNRTFSVRAVDAALNVSAPANFAWVIDTVAPQITVTANVTSPTMSTSATFTLVSSDTGGTGIRAVECRLDNGNFAACVSPVSYSGLALGTHTFSARAIDNAGNMMMASFVWNIVAAAECKNYADLRWTAPTQNTDGSALTDLAGYRILYGNATGNYATTVNVNTPTATTFRVTDLVVGQNYYFVMRSVNAQGIESANSNEATLNLPSCTASAVIDFGSSRPKAIISQSDLFFSDKFD